MVDTTIRSPQDCAILQSRKVGILSPLRWLQLGWQDFNHSRRASLAYGLITTAMGWAVLTFASDNLYLFTTAISGFLLISPLMATGLYELSRRKELGQSVTFDASLVGLKNNSKRLTRFAGILVLFIFLWLGLSSLLFSGFFAGTVPVLPRETLYQTFWTSGGQGFVLTYSAVGGVIALLVFFLSVVSVPMMMDRETEPEVAMLTSARAVWLNLPAMGHWAALLVVLTLVGFVTKLWGMIVIIPWLGHATWHAYRDTVECAPPLAGDSCAISVPDTSS